MSQDPSNTDSPPAAAGGPGRSTVKVLGTRLDRYVEFEFSLNDPDLTVDLVMPFAAFDEFCAVNGARVLGSDGLDRRPGLYIPASERDQPDAGANT